MAIRVLHSLRARTCWKNRSSTPIPFHTGRESLILKVSSLGELGKCRNSPDGDSPDFFWPLSFASVANPRPAAPTVAAVIAGGQSQRAGGTSSRVISRTYRADATILVLGITVFRRPGVGGGRASLEETGDGASLRRTLFFAAGSDPKHAHGLERLGWIREVVLGPASAPSESTYFGVLTSSPEESLEHARKTVVDPAIRPRVPSAR